MSLILFESSFYATVSEDFFRSRKKWTIYFIQQRIDRLLIQSTRIVDACDSCNFARRNRTMNFKWVFNLQHRSGFMKKKKFFHCAKFTREKIVPFGMMCDHLWRKRTRFSFEFKILNRDFSQKHTILSRILHY